MKHHHKTLLELLMLEYVRTTSNSKRKETYSKLANAPLFQQPIENICLLRIGQESFVFEALLARDLAFREELAVVISQIKRLMKCGF